MWWQLFLVLTLVWCLFIRWQNKSKREMAKRLKIGFPSYPFVGIGHIFMGNDEDRMTALKRIAYEAFEHDGIVSGWLGNRLYAAVVDPVDAEAVLKHCLEKDEVLRFARKVTGNGSIFAPVSIWRRRRKLLAPTFSMKNLTQYVTIFSEQSRFMVKRLEQEVDKGTFSIWKYVTSYTMDSLSQSTFGVNLGIQKQDKHPFLVKLDIITELCSARTLKFWLHSDFVYRFTSYYKLSTDTINYMTSFVCKIINEKRLALKNATNIIDSSEDKSSAVSKLNIKSFLELHLNHTSSDKGLTERELEEECMVMLAAGTDTSAVGASFVTVMLSKHPGVQDKLYEELIEVLGEDDRTITSEDLVKLKYLEAVIKETLRLYPPVPITARVTDKDLILPSGRKLVKDVGVGIHIWGTHRNPKYWGPDAEVFRPERFLNLQLAHPAAYMPFSFGPRNCVGYQYAMLSLKTVIATLVKHYKILPSKQILEDGDKPLRVKYDIMMKHVDMYQVQLVRRK